VKAGGGNKKAILAGAASMLGACDHMLRDGLPYSEVSPGTPAPRDEEETLRWLREPGSEVDARHAARSLLIRKL